MKRPILSPPNEQGHKAQVKRQVGQAAAAGQGWRGLGDRGSSAVV